MWTRSRCVSACRIHIDGRVDMGLVRRALAPACACVAFGNGTCDTKRARIDLSSWTWQCAVVFMCKCEDAVMHEMLIIFFKIRTLLNIILLLIYIHFIDIFNIIFISNLKKKKDKITVIIINQKNKCSLFRIDWPKFKATILLSNLYVFLFNCYYYLHKHCITQCMTQYIAVFWRISILLHKISILYLSNFLPNLFFLITGLFVIGSNYY